MMQPVSRFKGRPVSLLTISTPWVSVSCDPALQWVWLTTYQTTPPMFLYPQAVWIPEHTRLPQWERRTVDVVPVLPQFYHSSPLHHPHHLYKPVESWKSPNEVGVFQRRDRRFLLTNQLTQAPLGHASRARLLLSPLHLTGRVRRNTKQAEDSAPSPLLHLLLSSHPSSLTPAAPVGGAFGEWVGFCTHRGQGAWSVHNNHLYKGAELQPVFKLPTRRAPPVQLLTELCPSGVSSRSSTRWTVHRDKRRRTPGESKKRTEDEGLVSLQGVSADRPGEEEEKKPSDKGPVASAAVPGSPWCVVWTADDRTFFFNPTMHLSVWERPGDLTGRDISGIIQDPPHKRKKMPGVHGNEDEDQLNSKRNRLEKPGSLLPEPEEIQNLPLDLRKTHFTEMMLERGVSAFSSWDKELHKMVFDPRYLLLTSDQRKKVFAQFVKSRMKDEFREKKNKELKAREEFRQLLEEAKITSRSTFKEFCTRYRGDQRFSSLNRKKEQEVLFVHYITSLKKSDKENRSRLRKMR